MPSNDQEMTDSLDKLGLTKSQRNSVIDIFVSWSFDWARKHDDEIKQKSRQDATAEICRQWMQHVEEYHRHGKTNEDCLQFCMRIIKESGHTWEKLEESTGKGTQQRSPVTRDSAVASQKATPDVCECGVEK